MDKRRSFTQQCMDKRPSFTHTMLTKRPLFSHVYIFVGLSVPRLSRTICTSNFKSFEQTISEISTLEVGRKKPTEKNVTFFLVTLYYSDSRIKIVGLRVRGSRYPLYLALKARVSPATVVVITAEEPVCLYHPGPLLEAKVWVV